MLQQLILGASLNDVLDKAANDEERIEGVPNMTCTFFVGQRQQIGNFVEEHRNQRAQIPGDEIVTDEALAQRLNARVQTQLGLAAWIIRENTTFRLQ